MSAPPAAAPAVPDSGRAVGLFCLLSFALAWLAAAPLWVGGVGLTEPLGRACTMLMMFAPAGAAFFVLRRIDRPASIPRATGMTPLRPRGRLLRYCALGFVVPPLIIAAGILIAAAAGAYPADLTDFSGFRALAAPMGLAEVGGSGIPFVGLGVFVAVQLLGWAVGLPMMFGEEWGWRGYLLPALLRLGTVPALLLHGLIWGVWHAPVILLGYNFGRPDLVGLAAMTAWCMLLGVIMGWLRLASGSLWPAVVAHGATNSSSALFIVFSDADAAIGEQSALPMELWVATGAAMAVLIAVCWAVRPIRAAAYVATGGGGLREGGPR